MAREYRMNPAVFARLLGVVAVTAGLVLVLLALAVGFMGLPGELLSAAMVTVAALEVVLAVLLARWRPPVVRLDDTGYRVQVLRGVGVAKARWTDVEDVATMSVAGERCVVLRLRDGGTTTVPVRLLAARPDAFVGDLRAHLDRGHGIRRIR